MEHETNFSTVYRKTSKRKASELQIHYLAHRDASTGLLNFFVAMNDWCSYCSGRAVLVTTGDAGCTGRAACIDLAEKMLIR